MSRRVTISQTLAEELGDPQLAGVSIGTAMINVDSRWLAGEEPPAHRQVEAEEQRRAVQQVIEHMPDPLREVLVLAYYHRFPYKELAEVLDVPLGTVKSRIHAAVGHFARRYRATIEAGGHAANPLEEEMWKGS